MRPGDSSVYSRSIVLDEPPAPAARVLLGRALASLSFWSAAARRRIAVRGPPGGGGDDGRGPPITPVLLAVGPLGEPARGEACAREREGGKQEWLARVRSLACLLVGWDRLLVLWNDGTVCLCVYVRVCVCVCVCRWMGHWGRERGKAQRVRGGVRVLCLLCLLACWTG